MIDHMESRDQLFHILYEIIRKHEKSRSGKEVTDMREASEHWLHTLATCDLFEDIGNINDMILMLKLSTHDLETFHGNKKVLRAIEKLTQAEELLCEVSGILEEDGEDCP
jgi:hypothetical protein